MSAAEKIAMLETQRQEIVADLYRQQAECQAQAIEFANTPVRAKVVTSCLDAYRVMAEASIKIISNFDRRIDQIRREQLENAPLNQIDGKPKLMTDKEVGLSPIEGKLDGEK